ncbi:hypothetical protein [Calothrix sp. NIES-2100]
MNQKKRSPFTRKNAIALFLLCAFAPLREPKKAIAFHAQKCDR